MSALALSDTKLLVCVGPGGVGKTSLAAALAVEQAHAGRRVALLTIDPARRLADALGLAETLHGGDGLVRVPGIQKGVLDASMLETKSSFDALIARIAESPEIRDRILQNRLYESFSRTLARSHAYLAMERVHALQKDATYDLVVLDTPPTRSALEILDAPGHLARFLHGDVLDALLPKQAGATRGWLQEHALRISRALLGRVIGASLVEDLSTFCETLLPLRQGFEERALSIQQTLRLPSTTFVLVGALDKRDALARLDLLSMCEALREREVQPHALLLNRALPERAVLTLPELSLATSEAETRVLQAARRLISDARSEATARLSAATVLRDELQLEHIILFAERREPPTDVHSLQGLARSGVKLDSA